MRCNCPRNCKPSCKRTDGKDGKKMKDVQVWKESCFLWEWMGRDETRWSPMYHIYIWYWIDILWKYHNIGLWSENIVAHSLIIHIVRSLVRSIPISCECRLRGSGSIRVYNGLLQYTSWCFRAVPPGFFICLTTLFSRYCSYWHFLSSSQAFDSARSIDTTENQGNRGDIA